MTPEKWEFQKGACACARCGKGFNPGEARLSGLYDEDGALARRDFCGSCWEGHDPGEFSSWKTVVPEPREEGDPKRGAAKLIDTETLFDILRDTADSTDPRKMRFRFVVGLMLMRRKKLKLVSMARRKAPDGSEMRDVLVLRKTGRGQRKTFDVADVKMSEEEMMSAQDEVGALLGMDDDGADGEED